MKFKHGTRRKAIEYEKALIDWWKKNKVFEKSIENRPEQNSYVFYDGPPFITGSPHHGTLLSSIVKDAVPRYQTMQGKRVERIWGWDCHGLPAENFVEKQLGITDRRDIGTKVSLEDYITKARESMVANSETWESTIDRIGRWVDFKGSYKTMDKSFMESVWWAFKELYEKGKIYEGMKVLMYDTKFATPVSKNEVTMDNDAYRTVTDPSVYVKFKLTDENKFFLAWTTTPWTLPANTALAINAKLDYVEVEVENETFILAKTLLNSILTDEKNQPVPHKITKTFKGKELIGKSYESLFGLSGDKNSFKVYSADFVGTDTGTGIVHVAPAYGEADYELAMREGILVRFSIDENGYFWHEEEKALRAIGVRDTDEAGIECWTASKFIAKCLKEQGKVWKIDHIQHEYPFNPRSGQRLMYRAIPAWFFDVQNNKPLMLEKNENINWFPRHLKHGRFAKNIDAAPDWNLSRNRFWATPMPVWKGDKGTVKVIGSYAELEKLSGKTLDDYHRPWIDEVTFEINGEKFQRIPEVLDCWFESASMPFAQLHYPFENKEKFESNYPADFIVEYIGQVRAWFYYVHAVNTALFGDEAFKNVITTGVVAGNDGRKMSKSLGNFTDPNELMDKFSADSLRFLLLSSPLLSGEDFALLDKDVSDVARKLSMIWNMYDFFTMYAEVDGWEFDGNLSDPSPDLDNPLDLYIVGRVHQLRQWMTYHMDRYNIPEAMQSILSTIDDASNWYVRRSRRRFWKSEDDRDKQNAYRTLHYTLSYLALILAPFTPFLAEELWQNLIGEGSVHLQDWPEPREAHTDVNNKMAFTREIIERGLALRMDRSDEFGQIKVRQPLASLTYITSFDDWLDDFYRQIIAEEVNVKKVTHKQKKLPEGTRFEVLLDKKLTPELKQEGFVRELIRFVQSARKSADLQVDDRIKLSLIGDPIKDLPQNLLDLIQTETLATDITTANYAHDQIATIDGHQVTISLEKSA